MTGGKGTLYVVSTPIGNLSDMTVRGLEILKQADRIACEDTRRTLKLLNHYGIHKPLLTIFGPREKREVPRIVEFLRQGESVALVTDAGTPGLSDPGQEIVRSVREGGFRVEPTPGISAVTCAMSVSGYGERGFIFLGFLHRANNKIRKELLKASQQDLPIVFFESPFRVVKTLERALEVFGPDAACFVGREMTKKFEEYTQGSLENILGKMRGTKVLGEVTVILGPPFKKET